MAQQLAQVRIASAPPRGIGPQLVDRLARYGIVTAADFTNYRVTGSARTRNEVALIAHRSGSWIRVDGIGKGKARTLLQWRQEQLTAAQRSCPTTLPAAEEQRLQDDLGAQRHRSIQLTNDVKSKAQQDQSVARQREQTTKQVVDGQERAVRNAYAAACMQADTMLSQAKWQVAGRQGALDGTRRESERYSRITAPRFALFTLTRR